ncbi:MAG: 50S ribosomal protein L22 [Candidatus Yanofskybacteria bacterium]|nr:50S ribosomal protein L22 [Candidatus Yanofskybacteria bacterium]
MKVAKAKLSNLRIAPRKVRLVVDLIRGKNAGSARTILQFAQKKGTDPVLKLLNSAIANAQQEADRLIISRIEVAEGSKLKRWLPRARGQATPIQKKTSHITIELAEQQADTKENHVA